MSKTSLSEEKTEEIVSAAGDDIVVGESPYAMVPQSTAGVTGDFDLTDIIFGLYYLIFTLFYKCRNIIPSF